MWTSKRRSAPSKIQATGTGEWRPTIASDQRKSLRWVVWDRVSDPVRPPERRLPLHPLSFLLHHQFAVLHLHGPHIVRKLQPVALLRQLFLQGRIHERNRNTQIAHLEFRRIKGRVTILLANVTGNRDPDVFASNLGKELPVDDVAVEADLLVFDGGSPAADVGVRGQT